MHWGVWWGARKIHDLDGAHFDLQCAVVFSGRIFACMGHWQDQPRVCLFMVFRGTGHPLQALLADPDNVQSLYHVAAGLCCGWMALPGGDSRPKAYWVITHSGQKPHSMPFTAA